MVAVEEEGPLLYSRSGDETPPKFPAIQTQAQKVQRKKYYQSFSGAVLLQNSTLTINPSLGSGGPNAAGRSSNRKEVIFL